MSMQKNINANEDYEVIPLDDWKNYFYSTDFDLAVTLLCKNYTLATIDAEHGGKMVFVFKSGSGLGDVVDGYWSNRVSVNPLEFSNARKNLKSRIFGMRKNYK
jgi:hypothetical protein